MSNVFNMCVVLIISHCYTLDKLENNEMPRMSDENDGWVDEEEDEEEAKWIKFRRERDQFLEERKV